MEVIYVCSDINVNLDDAREMDISQNSSETDAGLTDRFTLYNSLELCFVSK